MTRYITVLVNICVFLALVVCPVSAEEAVTQTPATPAAEPAPAPAPAPIVPLAPANIPTTLIADFNTGDKPNNVGGDFGSWNYAPADETQGCWDSFETTDYTGKTGYAIVLEYDVKSPNPAFCGFWMKLGGIDLTDYDVLSFWARGDEKTGFTSRFKIEIKNKLGGRAIFTISGVNENWQEFNIPMKRSRAIKNWTKMEEITVVFDDILATKKTGKIYLDQIAFKKLGLPEANPPKEASPQTSTSK